MMSLVPIVCQERLTGCPENILSSVIISNESPANISLCVMIVVNRQCWLPVALLAGGRVTSAVTPHVPPVAHSGEGELWLRD